MDTNELTKAVKMCKHLYTGEKSTKSEKHISSSYEQNMS